MTVYIYPAMVAVNPNLPGSVVVNGTGQVYALTDTSYTTPLSITDLNGVHLVNLASNGFGLVQPFKVDGYQQVIFYAGGVGVLLTSPLTASDLTSTVYTEATTPGKATQAALAATYASFVNLAKTPDTLIAGTVTVDSNNYVTSAAVVWPDGTPGTLTITSRDATGAVLAYNVTYGSPATKTFTQPTITRNTAGAATNVPQIVVS